MSDDDRLTPQDLEILRDTLNGGCTLEGGDGCVLLHLLPRVIRYVDLFEGARKKTEELLLMACLNMRESSDPDLAEEGRRLIKDLPWHPSVIKILSEGE